MSLKIIDNNQEFSERMLHALEMFEVFSGIWLSGVEASWHVSCIVIVLYVMIVMNAPFREGIACVSDLTSFYNILEHCSIQIFFI
jgi:hypothetical protein